MYSQNPHDEFFRVTLSHVGIAKDLLYSYLPHTVMGAIDLNTLEPQKDSFINHDLYRCLGGISMSIFIEPFFTFLKTPIFWILIFLMILSVWSNRQMPKWRGSWGERQVNRLLTQLGPEYKVWHDVYVWNKEYGMTQIDHLVVSPYGLHVIETKHYSGWIFGSERQKYWTQVIYKKKQRMYNPIRQNYGHVQAIKNYLRDNELNTYSIIAFSPSVEFKFKEPFKTAKVVHFNELITVIKEQSIPVVNAEKLQKIQLEIDRLVLADPKEKRRIQKEHVKQVAGKQRESGKSVRVAAESSAIEPKSKKGICPRCNGHLVVRNGKNGSFIGCNQFPKCRYTTEVIL